MKRLSKKAKNQIRKNRLWKHWLYWLGEPPYWDNWHEYKNYDPEKFRDAFEKFQTHGRPALSEEEWFGIQPLKNAQNQKEFVLTGLCEEALEFWAQNMGWVHPLNHYVSTSKDRLTKVAVLRIIKRIQEDGAETFLLGHPKIPQKRKEYAMAVKEQGWKEYDEKKNKQISNI